MFYFNNKRSAAKEVESVNPLGEISDLVAGPKPPKSVIVQPPAVVNENRKKLADLLVHYFGPDYVNKSEVIKVNSVKTGIASSVIY
jgi:hypothetical protein